MEKHAHPLQQHQFIHKTLIISKDYKSSTRAVYSSAGTGGELQIVLTVVSMIANLSLQAVEEV